MYLCVLCGSQEKTAIISLYSINWLIFITETERVYCAVRTEYLSIIQGCSTETDVFNVHGSVHRNYILIYIYIQQDATLHNLFYMETAVHVSGGTITHHQERKQLSLQHLVIVTTPLLLSDAIVEEVELV